LVVHIMQKRLHQGLSNLECFSTYSHMHRLTSSEDRNRHRLVPAMPLGFQCDSSLSAFCFCSLCLLSCSQVKWKDLITDLNLVPSSLNAERLEEDSGLARLLKAVSPNSEVSQTKHSGSVTATHAMHCSRYCILVHTRVRHLSTSHNAFLCDAAL
jgi:hypothetical protein